MASFQDAVGAGTSEGSTSGDSHPMRALGAPYLASAEVVSEIRKRRVLSALGLLPGGIAQRFGRYVVLDVVGRGGMGTVLKAYDEDLDRAIAIKVLHCEMAEYDSRRLKREALALAKLSHPNVVHVYEVGEVDGQVFIAMELVKGRTLAAWSCTEPGWRECVQVYLQAGAGLAAAHAEGLVHRDFKPSNVLIDNEGRVRVLDFGLARQTREVPFQCDVDIGAVRDVQNALLQTGLTYAGVLAGTPGYMPPERYDWKLSDARGDQFSFCVSLWEALYGERPFGDATAAELRANCLENRSGTALGDTNVPRRLRKILLRGLAVEPADRWPSMVELLEHLQRLVAPPVLNVNGKLVMALGALLWLVNMSVTSMAEEGGSKRCGRNHGQIERVWNDVRRRQLRDMIVGSQMPSASDVWRQVETKIDESSQGWAERYNRVCQSMSARKELVWEDVSLQMICLQGQKRALSATMETLVNADYDDVRGALALLAELPDPSLCDDVDLLRQYLRVTPPDGLTRRRLESSRTQVPVVHQGPIRDAPVGTEPTSRRASASSGPSTAGP